MTEKNTADISSTISENSLKTEYLSKDECEFFATASGFLGAKIRGNEYKRVILSRAMPLTMPDSYICVYDMDFKELGIVENISDFGEEQSKLIENELSQRYFCPAITQIISVKEKFGNFYFDVMIGDFKKSFTVKNITRSIRYHGKGFDLIDVDGNRYRIEDYEKINSKSRRQLDPYLY